MICHVISRLARAWAIPISHLIIIILDFPSGESSISIDKQGEVFSKAMTPPGVSQAVSQRKQDGNLTVRTLLLCSDTKVLLLFVHDELQFKRSFQLKIGRYRLYISRGRQYNRYIGILRFCEKTIRTAIRFSQHRYIGNFRKSSFISVDSLRKGSCHVFVDYLSWKRRYINN